MPMLDIQRRHATAFRIRFGEKLGNRPTKLTDAIRVTSPNADVIDAFVAVYGGERKPWEGQWEAKLPTTSLRILVLPGQSISQWWERYRGSVCERRCDGSIEQKSGKPCMCDPDPTVRTNNKNDCAPTTRVSVICPDVEVIGSGMFICHGLIGAETLPQSIAIAEAALSRGLMVPAVLRVVEFKGRTHFIVPQIEVVGISLDQLVAAAANGGGNALPHATRDIEAGSPRFQPVRALPQAPSVSVSDQMAAAAKPYVPAGRANAAEPIRPTGLAPRTAAQARTTTAVIDVDEEDPESGRPPASRSEEGGVSVVGASSRGPGRETTDHPPVNRVAIAAREAGLDDDGRHDLAEWASDGRVRSSALLTDVEVGHALIAAGRVKDGSAKLVRGADSVILLKDCRYGWPITRSGVPDDPHMTMPLDELRTDLRGRIEALGDDGKKAWKDAGLPALTKLADEHRERALRCVASLEPF